MRLLIVGTLRGQLSTATKIAMDRGAAVTHAESIDQALAVLRSGKGADLLISDAATVTARLPAWYRQRAAAPTFLMLPLMLKGAPLGLIYADKAQAGAIALDTKDLALLRALRLRLGAADTAVWVGARTCWIRPPLLEDRVGLPE